MVSTKTWGRGSLLLACLVLVSCSEPLATGDYLGEPLARFGGTIRVDEAVNPVPNNVSIALFWTGKLASTADASFANVVAEQRVEATGGFPARYELTLYVPPSDDVLIETNDDSSQVAIALVLLYSDKNGDGRWDPASEDLVGGSGKYALAYAPTGSSSSAFTAPLPSGFQLLELAQDACQGDRELAQMNPVSLNEEVDLRVAEDVKQLLPDLDCDGIGGATEIQISKCGDLLRSRGTDEYNACVVDVLPPTDNNQPDPCAAIVEQYEMERDPARKTQLLADNLACIAEQVELGCDELRQLISSDSLTPGEREELETRFHRYCTVPDQGDETPPTFLGLLGIIEESEAGNICTLVWESAEDNVTPAFELLYTVYVSAGRDDVFHPQGEYILRDLTPIDDGNRLAAPIMVDSLEAAYRFYVDVRDGAGNVTAPNADENIHLCTPEMTSDR